MSENIDLQNNDPIIPINKENELRQITDDLLNDTCTELAGKRTMSVPISSLSGLGAAISSMIPALRTVTGTTTVNMQGLYTLANAGVGDALKIAKNGNFWGAFKTADGASKFVQLQQAGPMSVSTVTTLPINPATMMMAVALHSIEKKLDKIEETTHQILDFLVFEKESEIEADVQMLYSIISKYKLNWDSEHYVASNHKMVLDIQRTALKNMRVYQKQVAALLGKDKILVLQNNVETTLADLQKKFKYYKMALYTYSLASMTEIMLGGNFKEEYIGTVKEEIESFAMEYRNLFEKAYIQLSKLSNRALDTKTLKGIGTVGQSAGKFIGSIPGINKGPVDEWLHDIGTRSSNKARDCETKALREFSAIGNPNTSTLTERMQDMIQIYNHTEKICFDSERIYLVGESVESEETTEAEQKEEE